MSSVPGTGTAAGEQESSASFFDFISAILKTTHQPIFLPIDTPTSNTVERKKKGTCMPVSAVTHSDSLVAGGRPSTAFLPAHKPLKQSREASSHPRTSLETGCYKPTKGKLCPEKGTYMVYETLFRYGCELGRELVPLERSRARCGRSSHAQGRR
jgi:hypothetical protein